MKKGELQVIIGIAIVILVFVLAIVYKESDNEQLGVSVIFGTLLAGCLFLYALMTTEVKRVRVLSKIFLIIPILSFFGIILAGSLDARKFYSETLIYVLIGFLGIFLFGWIDKTKHIFWKVLVGMAGIFNYAILGIFIAMGVIAPIQSI